MIVILCYAAVILFNIKAPQRTVASPTVNALRSFIFLVRLYSLWPLYLSLKKKRKKKTKLSTCLFTWRRNACKMYKTWCTNARNTFTGCIQHIYTGCFHHIILILWRNWKMAHIFLSYKWFFAVSIQLRLFTSFN